MVQKPETNVGCAIIITTGKKYSRLSGGCAIIITTRKKKVLVVCLAGVRSLLRPEKKVLVLCLAGARSLLQPEKKVLVVCLAGARSKKNDPCQDMKPGPQGKLMYYYFYHGSDLHKII